MYKIKEKGFIIKNIYFSFPIGLILGGISWFVVSLLSDKLEPFDSSLGLIVGQLLLATCAFYYGFKKSGWQLLLYIFGAYIGMNAYAYIFGGSEHRAWAWIGLFTTIILIVFPLISGILGKLVTFIYAKYLQK